MFCTKKPLIDYDSEYDVLYYVVRENANSYGDEELGNIVVMKDIDTNDITGYTVFNFSKICKQRNNDFETLSKLIDIQDTMSVCGIA